MGSEETSESLNPEPSSLDQRYSCPTLTQTSRNLGSDKDTISGSPFISASSSHFTPLMTSSLVSNIMWQSTKVSAHILHSTYHHNFPQRVCIDTPCNTCIQQLCLMETKFTLQLDTCGLGGFISFSMPEPKIKSSILFWSMPPVKVLLEMRTPVELPNHNAISGAQHPFDAMANLSHRHGHGDNLGISVAKRLSAIVFQTFDSPV